MLWTILFDPRLTPAAAALLGAVIGVTGTLLVTIVNGLFGRNRYQREKIWERQQDACSTIVGALRAAQPWADRIAEGFAEDAHRYYEGEALKAAHAGYWEAAGRADEAFKSNYLILPTPFRQRYEQLVVARRGWDYDVGPETYLGPMKETEIAARDLRDIALISLGIVPLWRHMAIGARMTWGQAWRGVGKTVTALNRRWRRLQRKAASGELDD